ncbi:MAG: NAD(+) kinase [Gammaproteobacteria bacterium]
MPLSFNCIGLIGKYDDPNIGGILHTLAGFLKQQKTGLLLDDSTAKLLPDHGLETASRARIGQLCDLVIVIGGDGTLLNAARSLANYEIPMLGINRGRLGFLTDISPDHILDKLSDILHGSYFEERRILLHAMIERDGECTSSSEAFNDVVVHKWNVARMIEFDTFINGVYVNTHRSDGIIVATPTGSTAYALSSGGPILQPALNAMVMVSVSPHTMSNRPIVIDGDSHIEVVVKETSPFNAQVTCDGQVNLGLGAGDLIKIRKHDKNVRLIHPANHDHYMILRAKLHWGGRL